MKMRKHLFASLTLIVFLGTQSIAVAQKVTTKTPAKSEVKTDRTLPARLTGKVLAVNKDEKTVTVRVNGKDVALHSPKATRFPVIGSELVFEAKVNYPYYDNCEKCHSDCSNDCVSGVCFMTAELGCKCYIIADWWCGMR